MQIRQGWWVRPIKRGERGSLEKAQEAGNPECGV